MDTPKQSILEFSDEELIEALSRVSRQVGLAGKINFTTGDINITVAQMRAILSELSLRQQKELNGIIESLRKETEKAGISADENTKMSFKLTRWSIFLVIFSIILAVLSLIFSIRDDRTDSEWKAGQFEYFQNHNSILEEQSKELLDLNSSLRGIIELQKKEFHRQDSLMKKQNGILQLLSRKLNRK